MLWINLERGEIILKKWNLYITLFDEKKKRKSTFDNVIN